VVAKDLKVFLARQNVNCRNELLLFERFKRQIHDKLSYAEFIEEITPRKVIAGDQ